MNFNPDYFENSDIFLYSFFFKVTMHVVIFSILYGSHLRFAQIRFGYYIAKYIEFSNVTMLILIR